MGHLQVLLCLFIYLNVTVALGPVILPGICHVFCFPNPVFFNDLSHQNFTIKSDNTITSTTNGTAPNVTPPPVSEANRHAKYHFLNKKDFEYFSKKYQKNNRGKLSRQNRISPEFCFIICECTNRFCSFNRVELNLNGDDK
ncbi:uncharacterized protein LOC109597923 isoform X2 [Aethina tumida]|uniref:uncharacterized protein LOC109597923 isoform X2 n=1 Tax=Aethina tumida TaxID=116153 RepID=UPI00214949E8|nr:uncharacterized protein LOC109597923 isoform X2 [Aethina tumida]